MCSTSPVNPPQDDHEQPLGLIGRGLVGLVRIYQWTLRPFLGGSCRFIPSCSEYSILAVRKHGPLKGTLLTIGRICRCQPFCRGGVDFP